MISYAKKIQDARDALKELLSAYEYNSYALAENENITQDILHQIELGSYNEGRKWYGQLRKTRKARRENKDALEVLHKANSLLTSEVGVKFMRLLDEALGDARNQEKKLQDRHYCARYIKDLPISNRDVVD